jgi:hypothetical protein
MISYVPMAGGYAANFIHFTEEVIPLGKVPTPVLSVKPGTYHSKQTLSMTVPGHPNALILYTNNGYDPVRGECYEYSTPFRIYSSQTIKVIAVENGYTDSEEVSATYIFPPG